MYHLVKRAVAPHPTLSILRRNYWTQRKGPNYSTNMIVVGISTIICGLVGIVSLKLQQFMINVLNRKYLTVINNILDAVMVVIGTECQVHTPALTKTLAQSSDSFTLHATLFLKLLINKMRKLLIILLFV